MSDAFGQFNPDRIGNTDYTKYGEYFSKYGRPAPRQDLIKPASKSWLFEIVERKTGKIQESFTLLLPPESYTIKEPQRVSITKTFGNAFIDDYGPDNIQITLKGISGTAHVFPTFQTKGSVHDSGVQLLAQQANEQSSTTGYTGRDAFYVFRDKIIRYKDGRDWEKKELRVYDLADEQSYRCILLDFTLDRNTQNPLRYPFTISLFVYERLDLYTPKTKAINIAEEPISALNETDSFIDKVKSLYREVNSVINRASILTARSLELRARYNRFLTQTTRIITSPLDLAKNFIDAAFTTVSVAKDTYDAGKYTLKRYMEAEEMILNTLNKGLKIYGFQISEGWQTSKTVNIEGNDGLNVGVGEVAVSPRVSNRSYQFSGLTVYTVRGGDSLQSIALSQLGDENLWPYIASVNDGVSSNADISPGDDLYIPQQTEPADNDREQYILTEDAARNPYGTDIKLDPDGNIVVQESGDFALISGIENVKQAVDLRMNTLVGSMLKQSAFGLATQAGLAGTDMAIRYLKMGIRSAVAADPRIQSVSNIKVQMDVDRLKIGMDIQVIGYEESLPVDVVV